MKEKKILGLYFLILFNYYLRGYGRETHKKWNIIQKITKYN